MAAPVDGARPRLDPDELARLEEERDHLLRSIEDLDAEHAAGDVDETDYAVLRADYTARAAETIRAIEGHAAVVAATRTGPSGRRIVGWVVVVVLIASAAGWLLAGSVGNRSRTTGLTGSASTSRGRLAECQPLAFSEPEKGVECYDAILEDEPDSVEALTYRGWAKVRLDELDAAMVDFDRVVELDPSYPDVRVFRAVVAKDRGDFTTAQTELDTLYSLNPPQSLLLTMNDMGLATEVAFGRLDPEVQQCWLEAQRFLRESSTASTTVPAGSVPEGFEERLACFDRVLAARPDQVDALQTRAAFVYRMLARDEAPSALAGLDRAVTVAPGDPSSLLLRSVLRFATGDTSGAVEDVVAMEATGRRPSALFDGEASELRSVLSSVLSTTTTTTPS